MQNSKENNLGKIKEIYAKFSDIWAEIIKIKNKGDLLKIKAKLEENLSVFDEIKTYISENVLFEEYSNIKKDVKLREKLMEKLSNALIYHCDKGKNVSERNVRNKYFVDFGKNINSLIIHN